MGYFGAYPYGYSDETVELEYADLQYRYDDQTIANEAVVSRLDGTAQRALDATSQARYLRRSRVLDGLLHQDDATSLDLANWVVTHYKDPLLRPTSMRLEPSAGNAATHFPHVLGRELTDRVTIRRRPQGVGAAIDQPANIEGMRITIVPARWEASWDLSPADTQAYWLLDTAGLSELGQTTRLGF